MGDKKDTHMHALRSIVDASCSYQTHKCRFQITPSGHPIEGEIIITAISKVVKVDLYALLDITGRSHIVTIELQPEVSSEIVDDILSWL